MSEQLCINGLGEVHYGTTYYGSQFNADGTMTAAGVDNIARPVPDAELIKRVWAEQEHNTDRIRFLYYSGRAVVETEFIGFVDDEEFWAKVDMVALALGITAVDVMDPHEHNDCVGIQGGGRPPSTAYSTTPPRAEGHRASDQAGVTWWYGPDHGRMERQISLPIELPHDFDHEQVEEARAKLRAATDEIWSLGGVSVS